MASVSASAALAAIPALSCSTLSIRITIPSGTVPRDSSPLLGPLPQPYVFAPGLIDGIYSSS